MKEQIMSKINDKKQAIVKVDEKLTVLKHSLAAKQFSVTQMQAKQDKQWDALKRMEKLFMEVSRRVDESEVLRQKMREMISSEPVDEQGRLPEGVEPVIETEEYKRLNEEYRLLGKINEEALSDINRIYYGKA